MIMPVGPMRLQCKACGRVQWNPGRSDCIRKMPCKCGCMDFSSFHFPLPRILWPPVQGLIEKADSKVKCNTQGFSE